MVREGIVQILHVGIRDRGAGGQDGRQGLDDLDVLALVDEVERQLAAHEAAADHDDLLADRLGLEQGVDAADALLGVDTLDAGRDGRGTHGQDNRVRRDGSDDVGRGLGFQADVHTQLNQLALVPGVELADLALEVVRATGDQVAAETARLLEEGHLMTA